MINVSNDIKQAYNKSTTQIDRIKLNNNYYYIRNVEYSDDCYDEGNVFGTAIARVLTFEIDSSVGMEKKDFEYETGILVNNAFYFISLGNFIVTETEEGDTTDVTKVTAMDYMLKTNVIYETNLDFATATIYDVIQEVCQKCGLTLATATFVNSDFRVDSNQFEQNTLCRQVIQAVAQISGSIAKIKADNKLYFINPNQVQSISQIFTLNEYIEADVKRLTHPLNVVTLGMSNVDGENVTLRDEQSILQNGENALIINDNPFAYTQTKRNQLITSLFNSIKGFEYKSFSFKCQSLFYLETLDKIQFLDMSGNSYNSFVFRFNYKSPDGLNSTIEAPSETRATINYQNVPNALEIAKRTELLVDKQNQLIQGIITNVDTQNTKIAQMQLTVDELNSKIQDIADITTSQETYSGYLTFENINESEPVHIEIRPGQESITHLHPSNNLFVRDGLVLKLRTIRFTNNTTNEVFDYEIPDDLLYYDANNYDSFVLDYDSQTVFVIKKCRINTTTGEVELLENEIIKSFPFPNIRLSNGDYTVKVLKYDNAIYECYLMVRLMVQNIYTTQFATKTEVNSEINQTAQEIRAGVNQTLTNYVTTTQMNSAISVKVNEITSNVAENYETKNNAQSNYSSFQQTARQLALEVGGKLNETDFNGANIILAINSDGSSSNIIKADKVSLNGKTIDMTSDNIAINSNNFKVDKYGNMECTNAKVSGKITSNNGSIGGWTINPNGLTNGTVVIKKDGASTIYTVADLIVIRNYIMGVTGFTLSPQMIAHYDFNGDGRVSSSDYVTLQNLIGIQM